VQVQGIKEGFIASKRYNKVFSASTGYKEGFTVSTR
jgi:hypothetical protein